MDLSSFAYLALPRSPLAKPVLISTYPLGWTSHYLQNNYQEIDPVILEALRSPEPFSWEIGVDARPHSTVQQKLPLVVNEDNGEPYDESTYRHWVSTARAAAIFGFLACDNARQAIVRAERLNAELIKNVDKLFALFPLDEENKAQRARAVDQRKRALAEWLDAQTARDSNGHETAWLLKPCPTLMFVNGAGELDQKHDQDLRDTCVMLLDRAGCDLLTICDITGHSYRSAQTIVKHYRARNAARADSGIDRLE
nr:autoinducer binding domain-containing protein [Bradyrhizobium frederickii]